MTNHAAAANDDDAGNVGNVGHDGDENENDVGVGLVERICWNWG